MFYDTKKDKQLHPNLLPTTSILDIYSNSFFSDLYMSQKEV